MTIIDNQVVEKIVEQSINKASSEICQDFTCLHEDNKNYINECPEMGPVRKFRKNIPPVQQLSEKELQNIGPYNLNVSPEGCSLRISWSVPDKVPTIDIQSYNIQYRCNEKWEKENIFGFQQYFKMSDLLPSKTYRFKVSICLKNSIESKYTRETTFITDSPIKPKATAKYENDRIILVWTHPMGTYINIDAFLIRYTIDECVSYQRRVATDVLNHEINNVTEGAVYRFDIFSCSKSEKSEPEQVIFVARHDVYIAKTHFDVNDPKYNEAVAIDAGNVFEQTCNGFLPGKQTEIAKRIRLVRSTFLSYKRVAAI
ncbi:unnamed protein product [Mytilus edulis]|uniref:Fibronectin type-III domain-containing protein n=1 Tax=Mytilus edulis TaxID=6550 RepID=A0A8S3SAW1_MYTED|nr:unnamed protein product [Mytilus edulis]